MFYIRSEGQIIKPGINFYPLSDKSSIGFVLKISKYTLFVRYRKLVSPKFYIKFYA